MNKKYIFASSSRFDLISDEFEALRKKPRKLVFVPSSSVEYPFRITQEEELQQKLDLNLSSVISLTDEYPNWQEAILTADILYFHGGNPLVFQDYLKEKQVYDIIKNFEKTIIGISAGAMLMSQNITLTPSNDEYNEFVVQEAYGFGPVNIFPHLNFSEVLPSQTITGDGVMRLSDLIKLSYETQIDLLADDHFIVVENNKLHYRGDYFYQIKDGIIKTLVNNEWIKLNYQDNTLNQSEETTNFERVFNSMSEAMSKGFYTSLLSKPDFSFFHLNEPLHISQQLDLKHLKTWVIEHPEFRYATLSLTKIDNRVLEKFVFRTRYLKSFEQVKVWPKLLRF